ncbi:MAG: enoyl-CoA hydratase/carnithine racemase [Candidatus Azotimanducaceae bacterium]|jgi:enoyl-CoA hydratase/carnithine racemase
MELKTIKYEVSERIATITLSRPSRMNAWTGRMHTEYRWALLQADNDKGVGAIILTGEGRGFCVGADSQALEGHVARGGYDPGTPAEMPEPGFGVRSEFDVNFAYHFGLSKPIVVAINGAAAGVGLVLACYCDIRFAAPGIKLTTAHGKLNLPAEYGLSWLLPRQIGLARANDLLLTSRVFLSEEAERIGLINRIIDADSLMSESRAYVKSMIDTVSPGSLKASRQQIYADQHRGVDKAVIESESLLQAMMKQDDYQEGVAAFLEKRNPRWSV